MARPRALHGPTDSVLAKLHEAISVPQRIPQITAELSQLLRQVANIQHRQFLQKKLHEIEFAQKSPQALAKIGNEIDAWSDAEFPVERN
ncbi:MAG TPA: hypothetical protein VE178_09265 [Silvibacterium sp.]|jgi:hypothetical protein|nr:hypothetical protein [Silvibacterium sp.]